MQVSWVRSRWSAGAGFQPALGMFTFSLEPLLFVVGEVIFVLAIKRV